MYKHFTNHKPYMHVLCFYIVKKKKKKNNDNNLSIETIIQKIRNLVYTYVLISIIRVYTCACIYDISLRLSLVNQQLCLVNCLEEFSLCVHVIFAFQN